MKALSRGPMSQIIFAFGSNMCSARLRNYGVAPDTKGQAALLQDYRLVFNKKSVDGSGKANVESHNGEQVWGVIYFIPDEHLPKLDKGEGTGYRRERIPINMADGTIIEAWTYLASNPSTRAVLLPYSWYKQFLIEGAKEHGLPLTYLRELELIPANQDHDKQRDSEKRALIPCDASPHSA
jgi:gamma-glutamylcyclotransferase